MKEFRCENCNKLLAKYNNELTIYKNNIEVLKGCEQEKPLLEIKCKKCKHINTLARNAIVL